jgi:hypothetical protein
VGGDERLDPIERRRIPMTRRANGEGSIYRRPDGKWCATYTIGYDANGRRKRRYLYARTKAGVLEKLDEVRSDARAGIAIEPSRVTVAEYVDGWIENTASDRLSPLHLQSWHAHLDREGVSAYRRHAAHVLLKTILKSAMKLGLIARNPLDALDPPRLPRKEIQVLTLAQIKKLLGAAKGTLSRPCLPSPWARGPARASSSGSSGGTSICPRAP